MQRGRRVTLKDIARETGYTANTVSKALRDGPDLAGDTKRRIREAAERMGYVANAAASSLRSGSTRTIALVIADVANPFFGILVKEVEQCARQNGYSILVMNTEEDGGREVEAIRTAIAKSVDGVLLVPAQRDRAGVALLRRAGIPYVLVGRAFEDGQDDCVLFDDRAGGYLATRHLLEIGRRDILMVNAPGHIYNARERLRGYADALAAFGLAARPERVIELDSALGDVGARLERLAERGVWYDAVFAFSDHLAFAIVCQLQAMGVRVPADVAVIGFDDIGSSIRIPYPLSSISAPKRAFARACFDLLYRRIGGDGADFPRREVFGVALAARGSTAEI